MEPPIGLAPQRSVRETIIVANPPTGPLQSMGPGQCTRSADMFNICLNISADQNKKYVHLC